MILDAADKQMDLILCASVSRFARNVSDCITKVRQLKTMNPSHPVGVYAISIGKDVIRLLGSPTHVCLKIHRDGSRIILAPCAADDVMSFKVPESLFTNHHTVFRLHSKQFVHSIMTENGMDLTLSYTVPGIYNEKKNVACFDLKENHLSEQRRI